MLQHVTALSLAAPASVARVQTGTAHGDARYRLTEHLACIGLRERGETLFYQQAYKCDELLFFPLITYADGRQHIERRAILEGLWSFVLGTCQKFEGVLALRRQYGLFTLGDEIVGCNATPCFEQPEPSPDSDEGHAQVRNWDYRLARRRQALHHLLLRGFRAAGDEDETARQEVELQEANDAFDGILSSLLLAGTLRFRYGKDSTWLGVQPPKTFVKMMRRETKGDWLLQLVTVMTRQSPR